MESRQAGTSLRSVGRMVDWKNRVVDECGESQVEGLKVEGRKSDWIRLLARFFVFACPDALSKCPGQVTWQ